MSVIREAATCSKVRVTSRARAGATTRKRSAWVRPAARACQGRSRLAGLWNIVNDDVCQILVAGVRHGYRNGDRARICRGSVRTDLGYSETWSVTDRARLCSRGVTEGVVLALSVRGHRHRVRVVALRARIWVCSIETGVRARLSRTEYRPNRTRSAIDHTTIVVDETIYDNSIEACWCGVCYSPTERDVLTWS